MASLEFSRPSELEVMAVGQRFQVMTEGIYVSAGRFKAIIDMMDSDINIISDGEKLSISSAIGKQFVGLLYPLDQGILPSKGLMEFYLLTSSQETFNPGPCRPDQARGAGCGHRDRNRQEAPARDHGAHNKA